MEDKLISKKELLAKYGISYGALYRWKRMGLIPEDWFQKKSSPTGQETFFYRDQICERIELILSRGNSLEALAEELDNRPRPPHQRELIVTDRFTTRRYSLDELREIVLTDGKKETKLLNYLKGVPL